MKQTHRQTSRPSFETMTRSALKKLTRDQMLAAKFAEDIITKPPTDLITQPVKLEPMTFSLANLIPTIH